MKEEQGETKKYEDSRHIIYRQNLGKGASSTFKSASDIFIQRKYKETNQSDVFLLHDSDETFESQIIIFGIRANLFVLSELSNSVAS